MSGTDDTDVRGVEYVSEGYDGPWANAELECLMCAQLWQAVYPVICMQLECPHCSCMNPAPIITDHHDEDFNVLLLPLPPALALQHALYFVRRHAV